jgi:hypothetical protein
MDHLPIKGVVTKVFCEYIDVFMKIFLDDFIVFTDLPTHLEKLRKCFLKCREYGISLNLDKCAFMVCFGLFGIHSFQRGENT